MSDDEYGFRVDRGRVIGEGRSRVAGNRRGPANAPGAMPAYVRRLERGINEAVDRIDALQRQVGDATPANQLERPRTIDDIPGPRTWKSYEIEIAFETGATGTVQNDVQISTDGPFILTHITPVFQITDPESAYTGQFLPMTRYFYLFNRWAAPADPLAGLMSITPEMSMQFRSEGSGRYLTQKTIAGPSWGSGGNDPFYPGRETWFESKDNMVAEITPELAVPVAGKVRLGLHGYQIVRNISVAQFLGL